MKHHPCSCKLRQVAPTINALSVIDFGANIIFGAGGFGKGAENAIATAKLINRTQPYLIFTGTIHAEPGCPLYEDMQYERFVENTVEEYLDEEEIFLQHLEVDNCYYFGLHPSNIVRMAGQLQKDRDMLMMEIEKKRKSLGPDQLKMRPTRHGEGAVII